MFALLVLSVDYAILGGRTASGMVAAVAAHEHMLFGPAFGLSALLLLFALNAVLRTYGANRESNTRRASSVPIGDYEIRD